MNLLVTYILLCGYFVCTSLASERTEVIYGSDNVMNIILQFLSNANKVSSCGDYKAPSVVFEIEEYKKLLSDIKKRGIKLRYVTDITKDNVKYCRDLIEFFAYEIRHLDGIKANFSVSETEYLASATMAEVQTKEPTIPIQQLIYSNVKDIVEEHRELLE